MSDTRAMKFEAQKQAILDYNDSTEGLLAVPTPEAVSLLSKDIETAEMLAEQINDLEETH